MKKVVICLGLFIPVVALADEFPRRKPGLWEVQTSISGAASGQTMKQCVDAASDAKLARMGKDVGGTMAASCTKNQLRKDGANFVSESDCTVSGTRAISKTVFTGDFTSHYTGETTTRYEPPLMGMKEQRMTLTARWVGPCESGQKPGDIILPNGMKMNINSIGTPAGAVGK